MSSYNYYYVPIIEITAAPVTQVGYTGSRLSYSCTSSRGFKIWLINDITADADELSEAFNPDIIPGETSWLSVQASSATNNSIVTCYLYDPPAREQRSASILVQGTFVHFI